MYTSISSYMRIMFLIALLSIGWCTPSLCISEGDTGRVHPISTSNQHDSGEGSNPIIEYYLGNYHVITTVAEELTLDVVVFDPDSVDMVVLMYSQIGVSSWTNITMAVVTGEVDQYRGQFTMTLNSSDTLTRYQVLYVANDSIGNWAMTPYCNYSIEYGVITVDSVPDLYDTPDLIYKNGTVNHYITWRTVRENIMGCDYYLYLDDYLIERGFWGGELKINVDGLDIGSYIYKLKVVGGFGNDEDTVTVDVVEELPADYLGTSVEPIIPTNWDYLLPVGVVGMIVAIVIIVAIMRKR